MKVQVTSLNNLNDKNSYIKPKTIVRNYSPQQFTGNQFKNMFKLNDNNITQCAAFLAVMIIEIITILGFVGLSKFILNEKRQAKTPIEKANSGLEEERQIFKEIDMNAEKNVQKDFNHTIDL